MLPPALTTLCFIVSGDSSGSPATGVEPFIDALLAHSNSLHLGFSQAPISQRYVLGRLCSVNTTPTRALLLGGFERLSWTAIGEIPVHAWIATSDFAEGVLTTLLLTDKPATTDYILWFDTCGPLASNWWETLLPLLEKRVDCLGYPAWIDYAPKDIERIQSRPWYRGVPPERRNGRPVLSFMTRCWGLRTACLKELDGTGERNWNRWSSEHPGGWPVLLGEIAWQLNWSRAEYDPVSGATATPTKDSPAQQV